MSITVKLNEIKLKDQNGTYQSPITFADQSTANHIAEVNAAITEKGEEVLDSIPSDYTELTEEVSDLKSALREITGTTIYQFLPGRIKTSAAIGETLNVERDTFQSIGSAVIKVNAGDKINVELTPRDKGDSRWYVFTDINYIILSKAGPGSEDINETITAAQDGYCVLNCLIANSHMAYSGTVDMAGKIAEIEGNVDAVEEELSKTAGNEFYNFGNLIMKTSALCPESCTWVGDKLVTAFPSDVTSTAAQTARIYIFTFGNGFDADYTARKWFTHDWGHLNTIDYSVVNDALITTNGGQGAVNAPDPNGNGHIYIFPKFSHFIEEVVHNSVVNYAEYAVTVDGVTYTPIDITLPHANAEWANDSKYQAVWDNASISTDGSEMINNSIMLVSGIYDDSNSKIAKLRVCTLGFANGIFDGTITVDKTYEFLPDDISSTDFVQDMCLINGALYLNNSEQHTELWRCTLDIKREAVNVIKYRRDMNRWRSGIAHKNNMLSVGYHSGGLWFEHLPN